MRLVHYSMYELNNSACCQVWFKYLQFIALHSYLLPVGDNDYQYGGHTADDYNNRQSQQRPLRVAYILHSFLDAGHHLRGPDLQNPPTRREEGLELFVDVQEFTIEEPLDEKRNLYMRHFCNK